MGDFNYSNLVKKARELKKYTSEEFAKLLETDKSTIEKLEKGLLLPTRRQLDLLAQLLSEVQSAQSSFKVIGPTKLKGSIIINTSKNGATHLMMASFVNKGETILKKIPRIQEVFRMIEIMQSIGVNVNWIGKNDLLIKPPKKFDLKKIDKKASAKVRSFLMSMGVLAHFNKEFEIPHSGGCKMGERSISAHKHVLNAFGIEIKTLENSYKIKSGKIKNTEIIMYEASDTATTLALTTAALTPGVTTIKYAPANYQVQDVCFFLEALGVKIEGIGTTTLKVHGKKQINKNITHYNSEDPIEAMLFISTALTTGSKLEIKKAPIDFLEVELMKLKYMNAKFSISKSYLSDNKRTRLANIKIFPSKLVASPSKLHALPYPGLNIDNLPFFVPIATQALGTTLIHDWTWENRAIYFTELNKLGANITLADPHRVFITGKTPLTGSQVVAPPALRPSAIVLVAMLAAKGESTLHNTYHIQRGYENLVDRLNKIGAKISVI